MKNTWIPLLVRAADYNEFAAMVVDREASANEEEWPVPPALEVVDSGLRQAQERSSKYQNIVNAELSKLLPWEVADLERLAGSEYKTAQRWALALDVCTTHPGELLSTERVCAESGMTIRQWRDAPKKLPQHLKHHYPDVPGWPLVGVWGKAIGGEGQVFWGITREQADRWTAVRASLTP